MASTQKNTAPQKDANLSFLKEFLESTGVSYNEIAKRIGLTPTGVFYWFRSDDIRLSMLAKTASTLDHRLYISITDNPDEAYLVTGGETTDGVKVSTKRLHFLRVATKEANLRKIDLAAKLGITHAALTYWFRQDDISFKNLVKCARALNRNINIRFVKDSNRVFERNSTLIYSSITRSCVYEPARKEKTEG